MEKRKLWRRAGLAAASVLAAVLFLWLFGPVLLPFAVGAVIAAAAEPAARRLPLPRWAAAGLCVTAVYVLTGTAVWLLCRVLCGELAGFVRGLPALAQSLTGPVERLQQWLLGLTERFPDGIAKALREGVTSFFQSGAGIAGKVYEWIFDFASSVLKKVPDLALFLITSILSSFMLCAQRPRLLRLWEQKAPSAWRQRLQTAWQRVQTTFGGWCKAQLKLMGVTFLVLTTGFLVLKVQYPLLFGIVISLIDALPVFGTGVILIPWSLISFAQGNTVLGTGLVCLYGAAALLRTALEPRFLGKQIGMDPLLTLVVLYAGYRFFGVPGMLLFPLGAVLVKQFWSQAEKRIDNGRA